MNASQALKHAYQVLKDADPTPARQTPERGSQQHRLPINPRLVEAKAHLHHIMCSWALLIAEEHNKPYALDDRTETVILWLVKHAALLDTHEARADFIQETTEATNQVRRIIDTADDKVFCGWHGGWPIYARQGQRTITLPDGTVEQVETLRKHLRTQLLDHHCTAKQAATLLQELFGQKCTPKQITGMWREDKTKRTQGKLKPLEGLDTVAMDGKQPVFVLGEVLTRITKEPA